MDQIRLTSLVIFVVFSPGCSKAETISEDGSGEGESADLDFFDGFSDGVDFGFIDTTSEANFEEIDIEDVDSADEIETPIDPCGMGVPPLDEARIDIFPSSPWAGGNVIITVTSPIGFVYVGTHVSGPDGRVEPRWVGVTGEGPYNWQWLIEEVVAGYYCVIFTVDNGDRVITWRSFEVSTEFSSNEVYHVVSNHQWSCEEEYTWAINVDVVVIDENGDGIEGATIAVKHNECEIATDHPPPVLLVTDGAGRAHFENYSPGSITDWPSNICLFSLEVVDLPSDKAVEITTGIWEEQDGCNYCSTFAVNVWGHWSYTITFRKTEDDSAILCEIPTDHAGQSRCSPTLHFYEPPPCER